MVYSLNVAKNEMPYIGYEFSRNWDEEYGIGIMLHKDELNDIGGGDIAVLSWITKEYLEKN